MEKVQELTGMSAASLSKYGLIAAVAFVMFGVGASYITMIVGVAYPAFQSFLALESDGADDDKQWLTYWVCFGVFNIIDQFAGFILVWIPFYYFIKIMFLIYLFHPATRGAETMYTWYILPIMEKYEKQIEEVEKKVYDSVNNAVHEAKDAASSVMGGSKKEE